MRTGYPVPQADCFEKMLKRRIAEIGCGKDTEKIQRKGLFLMQKGAEFCCGKREQV
jgi:hypothetical protein